MRSAQFIVNTLVIPILVGLVVAFSVLLWAPELVTPATPKAPAITYAPLAGIGPMPEQRNEPGSNAAGQAGPVRPG